MKTNHHRTVSRLFDYFYAKLYKNPNFKLDLSINNQAKQVDNFIKLLSRFYPIEGISVNFFITYYSFAFQYWHDKITHRKIPLNWIIGPKTFKRFLDRTDESQYFVDKFLEKYKISLDQLRQDLVESDDEARGLDTAEENEKLRFYGEARLYHCTVNTTMYNHRSVNCLGCPEKSICKKLLKQTYPKIYNQRGYNN